MVTLALVRKRFITRICLLSCLLLQSCDDKISFRRPRSCPRSPMMKEDLKKLSVYQGVRLISF